MIIKVINNNTLILDDFKFKCCVGKYGITKNKQDSIVKTFFFIVSFALGGVAMDLQIPKRVLLSQAVSHKEIKK